jgi:uncharacterized protein YjiS (DUF1127 family)
MTTTTLGATGALAGADARPAPRRSFLRRLLAARQAQADRRVKAYLASLGDEQLKDLGFSAAEIRDLKSRHHGPMPFFA